MQSTEWRVIPGFSRYEVSEYGDVRRSGSRPVNAHPDGKDRLWVNIKSDSDTRFNMKCHRLVAFAFLPPAAEESHEVCHNDGNHRNNHYSNLRWDSHSANMLDAVEHGTHTNAAKTHCPRGHEYSPSNTYSSPAGDRRCRACARALKRSAHALAAQRERLREKSIQLGVSRPNAWRA